MSLRQHALAPLLSAFEVWRKQRAGCGVSVVHNSSISCARLSLTVHCEDPSSVKHALAEMLRVVEFLTHPGIDPRALHRLVDRSATECLMREQWCSYCDGIDRQVELSLSPPLCLRGPSNRKAFLAVLRHALFDWDESTALREFLELRSLAFAASKGAQRSHPIRLKIRVVAVNTDAIYSDLQSLLPLLMSENETFEFVLRHAISLNRSAMALIAASRLPVEVTCADDWRSDSDNDDDDDDGGEQERSIVPTSPTEDAGQDAFTVLSRTKIISLEGTRPWEEPRLGRLMEALRTGSPELKTLDIDIDAPEYDVDPASDARRLEAIQTIGRALFDVKSPLRLDELRLSAPICQRDLELLVGSTATRAEPPNGFRHRSIDLRRFDLATLRGAWLGHLLASSGGVQSLQLQSSETAFEITEIPALVRTCSSLRELRVTTSCGNWRSIASDRLNTSIETLELCISDRDSSVIASALPKLLHAVGHSLVSLSVLPQDRSTVLNASLATVIAQQCPRLQQLNIGKPQAGFVSNLMDVYAQQPCRLRRLSLISGDADERYDGLIVALSTNVTHPLVRVLRSLVLDVCGLETEETDALKDRIKHMLVANKKLHDVTLVTYFTGMDHLTGEYQHDVEVARATGWSSTLPPLRHRLATLSAMRRLHLPQEVLACILTMAGRPTKRYRRQDRHGETLFDM